MPTLPWVNGSMSITFPNFDETDILNQLDASCKDHIYMLVVNFF